jgi:glycosyltransferase involved in cell wall biosynthesis
MGEPRRVLMVGPALDQRGGIAAVERAYVAAWPEGRYRLRHVATYRSHHGSTWTKATGAAWGLARVAWSLLVWRPHLLHVHLSQGGSLYRKTAVIALARALGIQVLVLHAHASNFHTEYDAARGFRRRWMRHLLGSARRLVVLGNRWRGYFEGLGLSVPIDVLPNPILWPNAAGPQREGRPIVLTLGELGTRKGTYDILAAIPLVLRARPDAQFWLGGDGDVGRVTALVDQAPWRGSVRLLGWVDGDAKARVLAAASVFLLPSHDEGLPVAVLEAMAYGLPVITTPVGDLPDAVADGDTGLMVPPGDARAIADAVIRLLDDPALAEAIGMRARDRAREAFEVGTVLPRLFAIYDAAQCSDKAQRGD